VVVFLVGAQRGIVGVARAPGARCRRVACTWRSVACALLRADCALTLLLRRARRGGGLLVAPALPLPAAFAAGILLVVALRLSVLCHGVPLLKVIVFRRLGALASKSPWRESSKFDTSVRDRSLERA
jgi:hypothetical protein